MFRTPLESHSKQLCAQVGNPVHQKPIWGQFVCQLKPKPPRGQHRGVQLQIAELRMRSDSFQQVRMRIKQLVRAMAEQVQPRPSVLPWLRVVSKRTGRQEAASERSTNKSIYLLVRKVQ